MNHRHIACAVLLSAAAVPVGVHAQVPQRDSLSTSCTYATCALRLEPSLLGARLVRGAGSEQVGGRLGVFGGGVEPLLAGSDSTAAYARAYVADTRRSSTLGLIGVGVFTASLVLASSARGERNDAAAITASLIGSGLFLASLPSLLRAQRYLSRAVWWYNAALPR